ncbi:MAG: hypothetical protein ABIQ95_07175 [Bdellovibrionia bacterium]
MFDNTEIVCTLCLCLGVLGSACSTGRITLLSSPSQAEVYVAALGDRKAKLVGETPIKMTSTELAKAYGGAGPIALEFKKDGYSTVKTIITDIGAIDLTVSMDLPPTTGLEDQVRLNSVVDSIFESQRLAKVGREDDALIRLKDLEKEAPHLAATYELEGGIYYLQKKYKEALDAYTLASNYNPKNPQVVRMRNYLETSLGVRKREISEPGPSDKITENKGLGTNPPPSDTLIPSAGTTALASDKPPANDQTQTPAQKGGK